MTKEEVVSKLQEIKEQIGKPYTEKVSAPVETTIYDNLTNFLRNGPQRKVFLFNSASGDYEWEEDMTADVEISMGIENDTIFNEFNLAATDMFGKGKGEKTWEENAMPVTNYEDESKAGTVFDNIEWTPDYEGGAVFGNADSIEASYWEAGNEFIVLQKGKWSGDGNFALFVAMTIAPKISS